MTKRMFAFAAIAAGAVLLSACDKPSEAKAGSDGPRPVNTTSSGPTEGEPVECGPIEVDGLGTHMVITQPSLGGQVGCTEAFNVIDEYLKIPAAQRNASLEGTPLSDGWTCTTDDGETASIACAQGERRGDDYDFAFNTEPVK